uniref:Ribonuclease H-like domain-containing protein n=1 Tax=Tanacetum cinerariifolium TaxID=118510 RepID=A0A6L2NQB7_TANCI|nr:ribonuclease H-like domain-containing protein [Tanacetum cinerariifolium]
MNFTVYQTDVQSVFFNGNSKEEVYVQQSLGLESSEFPNHVCKLGKAIYGVKQAPRAWYLKGTSSLGCWYLKCLGFDLKGYLSSDYVKCIMKRKSTSGACELLRGKLVCWSDKKQQYVAMSFAKAEYVADAGCCANILWMKSWLCDYAIVYEKVPIFYDNASAITTSNNLVWHSTTKHIDIRYHFDHIITGDIEFHFIPTQYHLADIFTNPLDEPTFKRLIVELEPATQYVVKQFFQEISPDHTMYRGKTGGYDRITTKDAMILYCLNNGVLIGLDKEEVHARSMLLMALPNEHLMTFNQYKDAKTLFAAIKTRFGGNEATKKIQKTLIKQLYEKFSATSTESLDLTFNRLQKLVSNLDTMSLDDLYNNFKIVEQEVRGATITITSSKNMDFVSSSSPNSSNEVPADFGVSTASPQVSTANVSGATMYAFLANQPNGSQLVHEDLEQIYEDDLAEIDLKWQLALLSMRAKRFFQKTGKKITINGSDTAGYDKSKVECFNLNVEDTSSKAMVAIDEVGFDWSYMADDEAITNMTFMAFLDLEDWESEGEDKVESPPEVERKTVEPSVDKVEVDIPKQNKKLAMRPVINAKMYRPQRPRALIIYRLGANTISGEGWHMTGNISYLTNFKEFDGGYVAFGGGAEGGKITGKGTIRTADESHVLLKVPRKNNKYSVDMKNIVPKKNLTCLVAKATNDESMLWHRRLGHINFKNINKLVKETKDETSRILKIFINEIENLEDKKVKIIRCDNGTEFKNRVINELCEEKDSKLPITFWAEAVNTACYVQNRVLVVKPHFKTPYELFRGRKPALSFMRSFGCHVTILNTLDHLEKFDGKSDEVFFVGYSTNSKAFRVYNTRTRKVEENLHIKFLENKPLIAGDGLKWLFDIDTLTESMNYVPVITGTNSNDFVGKGASFDADLDGDNKDNDGPSTESEIHNQKRPNAKNSSKHVNTVRPSINTTSSNINTASPTVNTIRQSDDFFGADNDIRSLDGVEVNISNISATYHVLTTPNTRIHKDHSLDNVIGDIQSGVQTRRMTVTTDEQGFISAIYEEKTYKDLHTCLFACFLSQEEPKRITNALKDPRWVEAMIEEEVYVCQPPGFEDPSYPDKVYKVEKALYEARLIKPCSSRDKKGIFRLYKWLQVKQKSNGIFINQDKYVDEILRKFKYEDVKIANTPMDKEKALLKDSDGDDVDVHLYKSIIGSLMYLTSSRPDIMFAGQPKLGLWYPRDSSFDLVAYTKSNYARASLDRKSTSGGCEAQHIWLSLISDNKMIKYELSNVCKYALTENLTIYVSLINRFWCTASAKTLDNGEIKLNATVDGQVKTITKASVKRHLKLADADGIHTLPTTETFEKLALMGYVTDSNKLTFQKDEAITKEMHDGLGRATTTASSLEAEQGSDNISKTQTKATPSGLSSLRTRSKGSPECHFAMGDNPVQARPERLSNLPNEPPLREDKVTTLENELTSTKAIYNTSLITLTKGVKKLEKKLKHQRRRAIIVSSKDEEGTKDKGKVIMQESEPPKKIKKREMIQISLDKEIAKMFYEEEQAQILMDEEYAQQVQDQWISDDARLDQENLAQAEQWDDMLFDNTMESIRKFVPMGSEGQVADSKAEEGSSKEGTNLWATLKEESEAQKGHSKKRKKSTTVKDKNPSQPLASKHVVAQMRKDDLQATSSKTSLGVTGEERADQLISIMSASISEPIYSASTLVHSESASGRDTSTTFTAKIDPKTSC